MELHTLVSSLGYRPAQGWIGFGIGAVGLVTVCLTAEALHRRDRRNALRAVEEQRSPQ